MPLSMPPLSRSTCAVPDCGRPADTVLLMVCAGQLRAECALCNADAAALALGQWRLSIERDGRERAIGGRDVLEEGASW